MNNYFAVNRFLLIGTLWLGVLVAQAQTPSSKAERLENLLEYSKIDTSKVLILNALYEEYLSSNPLKAKEYAETALKLSEQNNFQKGTILSSENIAKIYHTQGAYSQANEYYIRALSERLEINDRAGVAQSYNQLGNNQVLLEQYDRAIGYYLKSMEISREDKDVKGLATTYTNLGGAYYRKNNFERSVFFHREALALADSLEDWNIIAINLNRLGETYFRQDDYKEALRSYRQLLHLGKKMGDKVEIQKAYQGLSHVYAEQGDYKKAYEYYQFFVDVKESLFQEIQDKKEQFIQNTQSELDRAKKLEQLQKDKYRQQNIIIYAVSLAVVFLLIIIAILFRNNLLKQKVNRLLERQKREIERKNIKLEDQKRKIENISDSINRKNETLEATFNEIERKNKDITASINYAKRIQESMLPRTAKISEALPDHFILFKPRDIVSGDFYWFSQVDGKIILAAVDCTGHGVPGAIMSMLGDSYLNQIINTQGITEPDLVLTELHKSIGLALNQDETNNQDGMDVALCVIDHEKKILQFAGASRSIYLVQDGIARDIQSSKLPIGGFQKDRPRIFTRYEFDISIPTSFYIFSDGFQDQFGGPRGRKFAKSRLFKSLYANYQRPMAEQKELLNRTLIDWMGKNRQMDDILLIGVNV